MAAGKITPPQRTQILQRRFKTPVYGLIDEANRIRSVTTVAGEDHYCIYIPYFAFDAQIRFALADHSASQRFPITAEASRWGYFAELNPGANPC